MTFDKILALPFRDGGIVKLLIGGIIQIIPIVNFFSIGYFVDCYERGAKNQQSMPEWSDWGRKFVDGLIILVINIVYLLIPMLILGSMGVFKAVTNPRYHLGSGTIFLGVLLFIIFTIAVPMAISNYAVKRSFFAAFDLLYIFKLIGLSLGSYIGAYFLLFFAGMLTGFVLMVPIIGWLFAIFAGFYLGCVASFLFGSVYGKASRKAGGSSYKPFAESARTANETAAASVTSFCGNCGCTVSPDAKFCGNCGSKIG
ncbi:DUF4013 domain-containing protein [Pelotomaculum propionicicum]|uniref:DUF4013 domain-containing protein n=1 Tax=Pelotomaculum propionicicum TaxID=258475 RepID=UPI003B7ED69D